MELNIRKRSGGLILALAAATAILLPAPVRAASPRFNLALGASAFLPSESLLRQIYGSPLLGLQARASVQFAGGWSVFAGYRSVRANGEAADIGTNFDGEAYGVRLELRSYRGGVGYEWVVGRWTFGAAAGAAWLTCRETWPAAGFMADKTSFGAVFEASLDFALIGPLGIFSRLEIGPTQRKDDILLGGFDAAAGISLRF
ncbi:MAG: hypothetical protein NTZ26_12950 [Candidatus Aminicenantes bacterium]|nr:hypothetical protein [Candidatus Aminicenantes bacterium]